MNYIFTYKNISVRINNLNSEGKVISELSESFIDALFANIVNSEKFSLDDLADISIMKPDIFLSYLN